MATPQLRLSKVVSFFEIKVPQEKGDIIEVLENLFSRFVMFSYCRKKKLKTLKTKQKAFVVSGKGVTYEGLPKCLYKIVFKILSLEQPCPCSSVFLFHL